MRRLIGLFLPFCVFASQSHVDAYRMGYTDGYEKGKKEGLIEGYRLAVEDFRKVYAEKLKEYEEIEAGKLLIKEARITYPRVYVTGSGRLVVEGCRLAAPIDDLLSRIPVRDFQRELENGEKVDLHPIKPMVKVVVKEGQVSPETLQGVGAPVYRKEGDKFIIYFDDHQKAKEFCALVKCESK